jgi:hypothetical protein
MRYRLFIPGLVGMIILAACGGVPSAPVPTAAVASTTVAQGDDTRAATAAPLPTVAPSPPPAPTSAQLPTATPAAMPTSDPITGAAGLARGALVLRPYAVMIDNHPEAYPQTGLDRAAVVFEALAEFGVTRFMAIYANGLGPDAPQIGPVRSTRLYFAQWAMGFHPLYAHAGGSPQGLELVESTNQMLNLDALHLKNGDAAYFARSSDRDAPHNMYTSSAELTRALKDRGASQFAHPEIGFAFKTDAPLAERPQSRRLDYFFLYPEDSAGWIYDPATNGFLRLRRGKPARDAATDKQLWTKNVVMMEIKEAPIAGDAKGRIEQDVIGSGRARVFIDGIEREVTWRKDAPEAQLGFYDAGGAEVLFNAGPIWIVALPSLDNLTVASSQ